MNYKIHFNYKLNDIYFRCKYCKERIHINLSCIKANTYLCKCNHLYKISDFYITLHHTKELKEVINNEF